MSLGLFGSLFFFFYFRGPFFQIYQNIDHHRTIVTKAKSNRNMPSFIVMNIVVSIPMTR